METPITNGTPHVNDENESAISSQNPKPKVDPRPPAKQTSSFADMRAGFLEEVSKFLLSGNVDRLKQKWNSFHAKDVVKRVCLEQALKDKAVSILSTPKKEGHIEELKTFLKSVLDLCINEHITLTAFVNVLNDVIDTSTLTVCEGLFDFIEKNLSIWKTLPLFALGKNHILRICNDLIRRLSKVVNSAFCGRILLFLAMFFPFSERSGLNIVSDFNTDVLYKDSDDTSLDDAVEIIDVSLKVDEELYTKFWSLQEFFRNPNICYNNPQWNEFTEITDKILGIFKKQRLSREAADRLSSQYKSDYFTKFLTSRKLLVLQLSDSYFRRTICLQILLLFQYLTGQIKTKPENHDLSESDLTWVKETTEKIYSLIKDTPPDGEQFLIITKNMVQREEEWSSWKNEGCPSLKVPLNNKAVRQSTIQDSLGQRSFSLLSAQAASGFDTLFVPSKSGPPQAVSLKHSFDDYISSLTPAPELKDFLADAIEESERKIDPDKKKVADPSFAWLSVKLISLKAPTFFSNSHTAVPSMSEYVDIMCKKLYRDLNPGLLLPPYMPAPKSALTKTKKPATKSTNGSTASLKRTMKPKSDNTDITVVKIVKGGVVKIVKTGQGVKVVKEGENDSSQTEKAKVEEKNDDSSAKSVKASPATEKPVGKTSEKTSESSSFAKPLVPGKSDKNKSDKKSKSPSPKPQRKSDEKLRKDERRTDKKVEKKSRERSVESSRKDRASSERGKPSSKSPAKRKASPRRDDHKSTKVVRVDEKPKEIITRDQIHDLAKSIASNWKKVAERLGYKEDEILYFENETSSDYNRAMNVLLVWVSDEDATRETLKKHLKSLGMTTAVSILSK